MQGGWSLQPATIAAYMPNVVIVDVEMPSPGWVVLAESYASGWRTFRPVPQAQAPAARSDPGQGRGLEIGPATGNFQTGYLEQGRSGSAPDTRR